MDINELTARYSRLLEWLKYAVHELPAAVLYGADGANEKQCAEWMSDLHEFAALCERIDRNHGPFIEDCRWHFEHYPHDLGRRRHFPDYRKYIEDGHGPLKVRAP